MGLLRMEKIAIPVMAWTPRVAIPRHVNSAMALSVIRRAVLAALLIADLHHPPKPVARLRTYNAIQLKCVQGIRHPALLMSLLRMVTHTPCDVKFF